MYAYSRIEYEHQMLDEMIESEMHKVRENVLKKLNSIFAHSPVFLNSFALTLAYGYWESNKDAEIVADHLGLGKIEFLALQQEFDAFKEEYLRNYEEAENF